MSMLIQSVGRVLAWQSTRHPVIQWLMAFALFAIPFTVRLIVGHLHGANPGLIFFPVFLFAAVILNWWQVLVMTLLLICAGAYFFVPANNYLLPVGWAVVATLNVIIITALRQQARELAAANDRQRLLFRELQHRVANSLQAASGALESARRRMTSSPDQAAAFLDQAAKRLAASADIHRRLNDPRLFEQGLAPILPEAVSSVIDWHAVDLTFDIEPLDLSFNQMSHLTMLVIEAANNAQKHVFQYGLGRRFTLSLRSVSGTRAALTLTDDGPGLIHHLNPTADGDGLGARIIRDLAAQLGGELRITSGPGTTIAVEFPCVRRPASRTSGAALAATPVRTHETATT